MSGQDRQRSQSVLVPPSRHISTPFQVLVERLAGDAGPDPSSGENFTVVADLLDKLSLNDFQSVRRNLKQNFKPFSDAAAGKNPQKDAAHGESLERLETAFLDDFYTLLQAAHFRVLSRDEWKAACDNDFTFTNPLEVSWDHMEPGMLRQFWKQREDEFANAASISEKVLVMHRGVHVSRAKGMFLEDKIDLLVLYLVASPFQRLFQPLLESIFRRDWNTIWPKISVIETVKDAGLYHEQKKGTAPAPLHQNPQTRDPLLDHDNAQWVERVTLKTLMPNASSVFRLLFKEIIIEEPTFGDALILYRRDAKSQAQKKEEKAPLKDANPEELRRNIHIKRFQDIPIADIEMIFPDKKVYLKPLLLIQLMVTILVGFVSMIVTILTTEASWSLIFAVLSIIATRAFQVWSSAQLGRQKVLDQITERLYEQTMDAQDGVIYFLLDQMADQHVKELILAYFLLLNNGEPLSQQRLDMYCEDFLKQQFGEAVDFAIENSLPVLLEYGLVTKDHEGKLHPVPIEDGRRILSEEGRSYFSKRDIQEQRYQLPLLSKMSGSFDVAKGQDWSFGGRRSFAEDPEPIGTIPSRTAAGLHKESIQVGPTAPSIATFTALGKKGN